MKNLYQVFTAMLLISLIFITAEAQKLAGDWKLVGARQNGKNVYLGREIKTSLIFGEGNRMSGNAGCNRYSTAYTLERKDLIKFEPIISTKMACADNEFTKQESTFFAVVEKVTKYQIKGNSLIFSDSAKRNVLRFERAF